MRMTEYFNQAMHACFLSTRINYYNNAGTGLHLAKSQDDIRPLFSSFFRIRNV